MTRDIEEKLHFMIESLYKWCKNHDFDLLPPLCATFHTKYPNKHWKRTKSCLMKMTGGDWRKLPLFWCHRPTYELKRAIFLQPPPVIFIKQLFVVFQCLLGWLVWKVAQSGGSRSNFITKFHYLSILEPPSNQIWLAYFCEFEPFTIFQLVVDDPVPFYAINSSPGNSWGVRSAIDKYT